MTRLLITTALLATKLLFVHAQEMYLLPGQLAVTGNNFSTLLKYEGQTCELEIVYEFKDTLSLPFISPVSLSFHPDGRLYMISDNQLIAFNVLTRKIDRILPLRAVNQQPLILEEDLAYLAISEEGRVLITEDTDDKINRFRYIDYDLRQNVSIRYFISVEIFGVPDVYLPIGGFLKNNNLLFFGEGGGQNNEYEWDVNSYGYWDTDAMKYDTVLLHHSRDYNILSPSIYMPPCEPRQMLATASYNGLRNHELIQINIENRSITTLCPGQLFPDIDIPNFFWAFNGVANTTDFRQSPLRIDLDADNSSFHATAGYYDTLTTCRQEAPVMDNDIMLSTCEAEVDYISFRLAYYDQPRLPAEYLTAEGYESGFQQVSPSRWEWRNPYGGNEEQIKEFLRSLRYHADWDPDDPEESRERVVITTMHVGEDSTSSWTVFQLEQDEVYAGRDTFVEYCPTSDSVNLRSYLSDNALPGGRFEPEPSGGDGRFIPGTDEDGEYLYIVESRGCIDTAVLTVKDIILSDPDLDTVYLCPGGRTRIGFPPGPDGPVQGKFSDIRWWDGSSGDSIWVQEAADVMRQVAVTFEEKCRISINVNIFIRESQILSGPDTTLFYCPAGTEIDLGTFLPLPPGSSATIEPTLQSGNLVFTPGTDPPGTYEYIVSSGGGCTDTALITLEVSATQVLPFEDVSLCSGQENRIGLPPGEYHNISWWNGDSGDTTTLTITDTGPFWVEGQQNGCTFRAEFDVSIQGAIDFPAIFSDTLEICQRFHRRITVQDLDSMELEGNTYFLGDQIVFSQPGDYTLTGYAGGCSDSKMITVINLPDPSGSYSKTFYMCEGKPLTLTLPHDSAGVIFEWSDGSVPRELPVTAPGEYGFDIRSGSCTFQANYTVIRNEDTECEDTGECVLSFPNAVTPNGDGWNDELNILLPPECGHVESVSLYNKWGSLLYHGVSATLGPGVWNGLPPGVYIVQVIYRDAAGKRMTKAGSVLVIR